MDWFNVQFTYRFEIIIDFVSKLIKTSHVDEGLTVEIYDKYLLKLNSFSKSEC